MASNKTVLVTGARGFIGSKVVVELQNRGWDVLCAVRRQEKANDVYLDLTDAESVKNLKSAKKLDAIVHLAASVGFNNETLDDLFIPNVQATSLLLDIAAHWNTFFIFSSAALIADSNATRITSNLEDKAESAYMQSKLMAENLINASQVKRSILRICGVYGVDGPTHLGLNRAINLIKNSELPIQVGSGNAKRNYLYVKDLAAIIVYALENNILGTHLVAGKEDLTIAQMLQMLCDKFTPGKRPLIQDGNEAKDQLVTPSPLLPANYNFKDAVEDMYREAYK